MNNSIRKYSKDKKRCFTQEKIQIICKPLKNGQNQEIKTAMKYYYTPIRMAKVKNSDNTDEDVEKLDHSYIFGGNVQWHSHSGRLAVSLKT